MTVFLVIGIFDYDGSQVIGVYDSYEKAHTAMFAAATSPAYPPLPNLLYDRVVIEEQEVK